MRKVSPTRRAEAPSPYPSLEEIDSSRRKFIRNALSLTAASGGAILLGAEPARAGPGQGAEEAGPGPVAIDLGSPVVVGEWQFRRLLVESPDATVAAALPRECHREGIRKAVADAARRFPRRPPSEGGVPLRALEAALARAIEAYLIPLARGPLRPLRVSVVVVPPPAPGLPIPYPRLGGVPPRPRLRGCGGCSGSSDTASAALPLGVAFAVALHRLLGGRGREG